MESLEVGRGIESQKTTRERAQTVEHDLYGTLKQSWWLQEYGAPRSGSRDDGRRMARYPEAV